MTVEEQIEARVDAERALRDLTAAGLHVVERVFEGDVLERLRREQESALAHESAGVAFAKHPPGRMARIDTAAASGGALSTVLEAFRSPTLTGIARRYAPAGSRVHDQLVASHDTQPIPITDVHFDAVRTIKCLVYLLDTDEDNGAFRYARGTRAENTAYREEFLRRGGHLLELQNVAADEEDVALEPICAPAGSLVLFDTDGYHAGGRIRQPGRERRVLRARTVFAGQPALRPRRFTPMWFRRRFGVLVPRRPFEVAGRSSTAGAARAESPPARPTTTAPD